MKKLPIIIFLAGLIVVIVVFLLNRKGATFGGELPFDKRPVVSLTPSEDGHWIKLVVDKIEINAESFEYELVYVLPDGGNQGTGGSVSLDEVDNKIERELLLGSESSGNYYYDEGVETGTYTFRFKDSRGNTIAEHSTDFRLLSGTKELTSSNGEFKFTLQNEGEVTYFVVMSTVGAPNGYPDNFSSGPWGVFSSKDDNFAGEVNLEEPIWFWDSGNWRQLEGVTSGKIGIFVSSK